MASKNIRQRQTAPMGGDRPRVLVVSETLGELADCRTMLQTLGCEAHVCSSYAEGLQCVESLPWDMILVEQGSPVFEGQVVLVRAVEINRDTPVIILSAWHNIPAYIQAMHLGAVDYLEKPISLSQMRWILETHLRVPHWQDARLLNVDRYAEGYAKESRA